MEDFRFADNLDTEAVVALGLPAPRLVLAGLGAATVWAVAELPLPDPVRLGAASFVALTTVVLAWGKLQGVSVARWAWLAMGYVARVTAWSGEPRHRWVDADASSGQGRDHPGSDRGAPLVAFLSLRRGAGCTTVCRAVATHLGAEPQQPRDGLSDWPTAALWTVADRSRGHRSAFFLIDWGSGPRNRPAGSRLAGLILVWDGVEPATGDLADQVPYLLRDFPGVEVLVALNRAGPAGGLSARISGAGARLAASLPSDERLADGHLIPAGAPAAPSADGVKVLAREVLAASRSW